MASAESESGHPAPAGEGAEPTATEAVPLRYVESSALVATFTESDDEAREAIRAGGRRITSMLTLAEANRAILRARASERLTAEEQRRATEGLRTFARRTELVAVSEEILTRAGRTFPVEPVRTLDAIHLATVELVGVPAHLVTVVTRDGRVSENAREMGFAIEP